MKATIGSWPLVRASAEVECCVDWQAPAQREKTGGGDDGERGGDAHDASSLKRAAYPAPEQSVQFRWASAVRRGCEYTQSVRSGTAHPAGIAQALQADPRLRGVRVLDRGELHRQRVVETRLVEGISTTSEAPASMQRWISAANRIPSPRSAGPSTPTRGARAASRFGRPGRSHNRGCTTRDWACCP